MKKKETDNKKLFGILSLALAIFSLALPLVWLPDSLSAATTFVAIFILLAIGSVVLGVIGKKDAKGISIAGIVVGIISTLFLLLTIAGLSLYKSARDCVKLDDNMSQCELMGQQSAVPTNYLKEDQFKKDE